LDLPDALLLAVNAINWLLVSLIGREASGGEVMEDVRDRLPKAADEAFV